MDELIAKAREYYEKALAWLKGLNFRKVIAEIRTMNWVELGRDIRHWVQKNRNNVLIGLGIVAAVVIGLIWYGKTQTTKNDEAASYLNNGLNSYNRALQARDITPEDRKNEMTRALQLFQYVIRQYPGAEVVSDAVFYMGNGFFASGNYNESLQQYQDYLRKYPRRYMAPFAVESIGYCYEQLGDTAKASDFYKKVRQLYPDSPIAGRVGINLGRLAELQRDDKSAFESYQSVVNTYPNTKWGQSARLRMAYLESKYQYMSQQQGQRPQQAAPAPARLPAPVSR